MKPSDIKLALALPTYDGNRMNTVPLMRLARELPLAYPIEAGGSLLAMIFNMCLGTAMKMHAHGAATHFLMLHADVIPQGEGWFAKLWNEYEKHDAQLMSAIVPVKDERGYTSTAIDSLGTERARRLTMTEVLKMDVTFTHPRLLLNTGMMLFDLSLPWVKKCYFHIEDSLTYAPDGEPIVGCVSEDWLFSRMVRAAGCPHDRIFATRAVDLVHVGQQKYPSNQAWGNEIDDGTT